MEDTVLPPPVGTVRVYSPGSASAFRISEDKISVRFLFSSVVGSRHPASTASSLSFSASRLSYCPRSASPPSMKASVSRKSASTRQEKSM